jgi:prepilin-type N-terminal cleavage/methylation domain-containing protein
MVKLSSQVDNARNYGKYNVHTLHVLMKYTWIESRSIKAFTLVEMLVVIAIIGTLAGLLLPVLMGGKNNAKITKAKTDMVTLVGAISAYLTTYGRSPCSIEAAQSSTPTNPDFTFGTVTLTGATLNGPKGILPKITNNEGNGYQNCNAEIMGILLDLTNYPGGGPTVNVNHSKNPQRIVFFEPKRQSDLISQGLGLDGVYRDPWGDPYIITLDMNGDSQCRDEFYKLSSVSGVDGGNGPAGLNGLSNPSAPTLNSFEAGVTAMVWSLGPDGDAAQGLSANVAPNKDNVLSW